MSTHRSFRISIVRGEYVSRTKRNRKVVNLLELSTTDLADLAKQFLRCPACKSQVRFKMVALKYLILLM